MDASDEPRPVIDYARRWPSRRLSMLNTLARGVGIALICVAHVLLTCGVCQFGMALDRSLNGTTAIAGEGLGGPSVLLIIGTVMVIAAFRLICGFNGSERQ